MRQKTESITHSELTYHPRSTAMDRVGSFYKKKEATMVASSQILTDEALCNGMCLLCMKQAGSTVAPPSMYLNSYARILVV